MKSRVSTILIAATLILVAGCGQRGGMKNTTATEPHKLTMPQPPATLTSDSARLDYVVAHYWDTFERTDTTWITDTVALEQAFANWTGVLRYLPEAKATENITAFFRSTDVCPSVRDRLLEVAEHYFYDPNSPLRNEELFIPVLRYIIASPTIEEVYKIRPRYLLEMALKNTPGAVATDFAYTLADGKVQRLSEIRASHTLLLFYNPNCGDCARVEKFIDKSPVIAPLIASRAVKVLAMYVDADFKAWREHLHQMPAEWTVACDPAQTMSEQELYDLRAIPCLYLLDAQKRIVLKDAPVEQIEAWLAALQKSQ